MDLSTIKKNLDTGGYSDPWQYVEDVWLMFENAWLYNRKTSRVHKFSTKVCKNKQFSNYIHFKDLFNLNSLKRLFDLIRIRNSGRVYWFIC